MYSSEILDGINLSEYPSSDTRKNNEIEYQVMEKISQSLSETQQQYTGLPIGYIDRNSPYAPITIDQILKLQLLKNKSQSILLGNAHLLTHSHTITYGGMSRY